MTDSDKSVIEFLNLEAGMLCCFPFPYFLKVCDLHDCSFQTYYSL